MWQGSKKIKVFLFFPSFFFFLLPLLLLPPPSLSPSLCFLSPWLEIEPRTLCTLVPFSTPFPLPGWEIKRKGHVKCTLLGMWSQNGSFLPKSWAAFQGLQVRASTRPRLDRQEQVDRVLHVPGSVLWASWPGSCFRAFREMCTPPTCLNPRWLGTVDVNQMQHRMTRKAAFRLRQCVRVVACLKRGIRRLPVKARTDMSDKIQKLLHFKKCLAEIWV